MGRRGQRAVTNSLDGPALQLHVAAVVSHVPWLEQSFVHGSSLQLGAMYLRHGAPFGCSQKLLQSHSPVSVLHTP